MLTHAEARAAAGIRNHIYDALYARCLFRYRRMVAEAIENYHAGLGAAWQRHGRPSSSPKCEADLKAQWAALVLNLRIAAEIFNTAPSDCLDATLQRKEMRQ